MHAMCYECASEHLIENKSQERRVCTHVSIKGKHVYRMRVNCLRFAQLHSMGGLHPSSVSAFANFEETLGDDCVQSDTYERQGGGDFRADNFYAGWLCRTRRQFCKIVSALLSFYVQSRDATSCFAQRNSAVFRKPPGRAIQCNPSNPRGVTMGK